MKFNFADFKEFNEWYNIEIEELYPLGAKIELNINNTKYNSPIEVFQAYENNQSNAANSN